MANARGGHYQAPLGGGQGQNNMQVNQFNAYAAAAGQGGQYYMSQQQQQQQQYNYQQYYGGYPQQQQQQQGLRYGTPTQIQQQQQQAYPPQQQVLRGAIQPQPPPPPPPPPPGEAPSSTDNTASLSVPNPSPGGTGTGAGGRGPAFGRGEAVPPPLLPPPLPPMFPWMSPALAESMTSSQFGKSFEEQVSSLPFVPIIVNDSDLAKMTENVKKEAEQIQSHQLQYYKDVVNQDLPQALKDMFQPLYCKLCTLTLSSPVVAKDHYNGKRHKKAIEAWFIKNPEHFLHNEPPKVVTGGSKPETTGPMKSFATCGGMGGPINGFVTKLQNQNPHNTNNNRNGSVPPPPSLLDPENPNSIPLPQKQTPQPLIPGLKGKQQQQFDRNRPAAAAPPSINNSQKQQKQQQNSNVNNTLQGSNSAQTRARQPPLPPFLNKNKDNSNNNYSEKSQGQASQSQHTPGLTWQRPPASNLNEFQQQPAKKPKLEDKTHGTQIPQPQMNQQQLYPPKGNMGTPAPSTSQAQNNNSKISMGGSNTPQTQAQPPQKTNIGGVSENATSQPKNNSGGSGDPSPSNAPPPPPSKPSRVFTMDDLPPGAKGLCRICNVALSSPVQAEQHFKGSKHATKVQELKDQGVTDLPPPILPPPPQPKSQLPPQEVPNNKNNNPVSAPAAQQGLNPGPANNNRQFNNFPQVNNNNNNAGPGNRGGGGGGGGRGGRNFGGGGPRFPNQNKNNSSNNSNNNRNNSFNNQRHNNRFNNKNRGGPRF